MEEREKTLITEILGGNKEAFKEIVEKYKATVFYIGLKFFSNSSDAEDFSQEVFIRAYEKLAYYSGKGSFAGWLYKMAYNVAINSYHTSKKRFFEKDLNENIPASSPKPDAIAMEVIDRNMVEQEIKKLPPGYQMVFKLKFFDNFSYPEISDITGLPVNTIKSHIFRGRGFLKRRLQRKEE